MPKLLLVAQAHGMPPSTIFQRVLSRRVRAARRRAVHVLRLDAPRLTPRSAAAIVKFRATAAFVRTTLPAGVPSAVQPVALGTIAQLYSADVFPRAVCFVQVELYAFAIRWTDDKIGFFSLHTIEGVQLLGGIDISLRDDDRFSTRRTVNESTRRTANDRSSARCSAYDAPVVRASRRSRLSFLGGARFSSGVRIRYTDRKAKPRVLELRMGRRKAVAWAQGLQVLLESEPDIASLPHWRWVLSCMAATSRRGAAGYLCSAELRSLLTLANASPHIGATDLKKAVQQSELLELPAWLLPPTAGSSRSTSRHSGGARPPANQKMLNVRQVTHVLLQLCVLSREITELFERHAINCRMPLAQWLTFIRSEQLATGKGEDEYRSPSSANDFSEADEAELAMAPQQFEQATSGLDLRTERALDPLNFGLHLLSPSNDAVAPARDATATSSLHTPDVQGPLACMWTATSHNSCALPGLEPCLLDSLSF